MQNKFKIGDSIICTDPRIELTFKKIYKILGYKKTRRIIFVQVKDDNGNKDFFFEDRFEKCKPYRRIIKGLCKNV